MSTIPPRPGIYKITCDPTGKVYVGSALRLSQRRREHLSTLRRDIHRNIYLQRAFNKYGEQAFTFTILEFTEPDCLLEREQRWIDDLQACKKESGYNLSPVAGSRLGAIVSDLERIAKKLNWSIVREIRARYNAGGITQRELSIEYGIAPPNISVLVLNKSWHDPDYIPDYPAPDRAGEENHQSRATWNQVREIRALWSARAMSRPELAVKFGLSHNCITRIVYNETWHDSEYTPPCDKWKPNYKFNLDIAREIRARHTAGGVSCSKIAREYGVDVHTITNIVNGKTWREPE